MFLSINMSSQACQPAAFQGTALKSDFFVLPDVGWLILLASAKVQLDHAGAFQEYFWMCMATWSMT